MTPRSAASRDTVIDFWRGVSILLVIFQHLVYYRYRVFRQFIETTHFSGTHLHELAYVLDKVAVAIAYRSGDWGVRTFFVISGYIITYLMLREESIYGAISLENFYVRRVSRILPAYVTYLAFVLLFGLIGWIHADIHGVFDAAAFLCNTNAGHCSWNIGHTWTLAIEEQFYIFWPLMFLILPRRTRVLFAGSSVAIFLALSSFGIGVTTSWVDNGVSFACIALGALYALSEGFQHFVRGFGISASAALLVVIVALNSVVHMQSVAHILFREVTPFLILVAIVSTYRLSWLTKSRPFAAIASVGLVSYSLYLWQQLFTNFPDSYPVVSPLQDPLWMVPIAIVSYLWIERPPILWAKRFSKRHLARQRPHEAAHAESAASLQ